MSAINASPPPCLDCREPIADAVRSDGYPEKAQWSRCYLCAFCRTHRYRSERHAMARIWAGFERARAEATP